MLGDVISWTPSAGLGLRFLTRFFFGTSSPSAAGFWGFGGIPLDFSSLSFLTRFLSLCPHHLF